MASKVSRSASRSAAILAWSWAIFSYSVKCRSLALETATVSLGSDASYKCDETFEKIWVTRRCVEVLKPTYTYDMLVVRIRVLCGNFRVQRKMFLRGSFNCFGLLRRLLQMAQTRIESVSIGNVFHSANLISGIHVGERPFDGATSIGHLTVRSVNVPWMSSSRITKRVRFRWGWNRGDFFLYYNTS